MARRRFTTLQRKAPKRQGVWVGIDLATAGIGGNASVLLGSLNAAGLAQRPFTVVRSRMTLFHTSDQNAASEDHSGVLSLQVVTEAAAAVGIGSVPTPLTEFNADYFVYQPFLGVASVQAVAATGENGPINDLVDSKAMRKVGIDDDIAIVIQTASGSQGTDIAVIG